MVSNRFISFEGIDGAGKSSQIKLLAAHLSKRGGEVVATREPFDEDISALLHRKAQAYSARAQLFLLTAARAQHCETLIKPALARGARVLSDRFSDSTLAYQGYGLGLDRALITQQNNLATQGLEPDIVFIMDIAVDVMVERLSARGGGGGAAELSSYEKLGQDFFERVRQGYLEIAKTSKRYQVIDAAQSEPAIAQLIREKVE